MRKIEDPKNRESIREIMRQGAASEFWQLVLEVLDQNIEHQQTMIEGDAIGDLGADEYKINMEVLKSRKRYLTMLKELPNTVILSLERPDQKEVILDPYYKPEELT